MWRDFRKDDFPDNVGIFSHGLAIRVLLMRWFHWPYEEYEKLRNPKNGAIITMELDSTGRYVLKTHLEKYP